MTGTEGIYWLQGFADGEWHNLERSDNHDDAIAAMGPLMADRRFGELRLVLAESRDERIDYTTLVKTRDGVVLSDGLLEAAAPPEPASLDSGAVRGGKRRLLSLVLVLIVAIGAGFALSQQNPELAVALFDRIAKPLRPTEGTDPATPEREPVAGTAKSESHFADRLFEAVDSDDTDTLRRLMASRPGDMRLDDLSIFVDDGWGTGKRQIVDYALLGGHLATADILLSAGATPSDWLRRIVKRNAGHVRLRKVIDLLNEFGVTPKVSIEAAIEETNREFGGN